MAQGDGTERRPVKRGHAGGGQYTDWRGETRSARGPGGRARRRPGPDQGGLATAGQIEPSGPDRGRPDGRAGRDAADGRDQRRLHGADPRGGGGPPGTGRRARRLRGRTGTAARRTATAASDAARDASPGHDRHVPSSATRPPGTTAPGPVPGPPHRNAAPREPPPSRPCAVSASIPSHRAHPRRPARSSGAGSVTSGGRSRQSSTWLAST